MKNYFKKLHAGFLSLLITFFSFFAAKREREIKIAFNQPSTFHWLPDLHFYLVPDNLPHCRAQQSTLMRRDADSYGEVKIWPKWVKRFCSNLYPLSLWRWSVPISVHEKENGGDGFGLKKKMTTGNDNDKDDSDDDNDFLGACVSYLNQISTTIFWGWNFEIDLTGFQVFNFE